MKIVALVAAGALVSTASATTDGRVLGAKTLKACAAAGPYWPTMTLALDGGSAWIACKEQSRVVRLNTTTGKLDRTVRLDAPVIAVASGFGAIWAVDSASTLYRIQPANGRVTRRIGWVRPPRTTSGSAEGPCGSPTTSPPRSFASRRSRARC
jgi:streptogramin lyase